MHGVRGHWFVPGSAAKVPFRKVLGSLLVQRRKFLLELKDQVVVIAVSHAHLVAEAFQAIKVFVHRVSPMCWRK
jgi:hypothetical protein